MKCKMLFRVGLTLVILVAVLLFYLNNRLDKGEHSARLSLVHSDDLAFEEARLNIKARPHGDAAKKDSDNSQALLDSEARPPVNEADKDVDSSAQGGEVERQVVAHADDEREKEEENLKQHHEIGGRERNDTVVLAGKDRVVERGSDQREAAHSGRLDGASPALQPAHHSVGQASPSSAHRIHLAVVACGDRAPETLVLLKSAALLTPAPTALVIYVFAERDLHPVFLQELKLWPLEVLQRVEYRIYDIAFPNDDTGVGWKKLFKPCASQRLFLPSLLTDVDSLIYVDTDILFLSPLTGLWDHFSRFSPTQSVALAPEHQDPNVGWYNRFARHPFVPPLGVNSGVMLMNLTRLRQSSWLPDIVEYHRQYRLQITWGDQDLINIYFHFHPEELYQYSCEWNFRPDHCMYMSVCKPAEQTGAYVLHGCRRVMQNDKQPAFRAVYQAFRDYKFGEDPATSLMERLTRNLEETKGTPCGKVSFIFLKQISLFLSQPVPLFARSLQ